MPRPGAEAVHNKQKYAKPAPFSREKLAAMYDFTGQRAVVKGGTGILGGGLACALSGCGAQVAILGQNLECGRAGVAG
ncbi:MAG: hypothetical protein DMG70_24515 [Acidobacteria bacterium]|nr:MAG: hypothetical protein DMG70_24515 [Acidobacteriota bacterium]